MEQFSATNMLSSKKEIGLYEGGINIREDEIEYHKKRIHGFECPWNIFQVSLYLLFITDLVIFFGLIKPEIHFQILNLVLIAPMAVTCVLATYRNPEDPVVIEQKRVEASGG